MANLSELDYTLTITFSKADENCRRVRDGLIAYNVVTLPRFFDPKAQEQTINVFLHDADGNLIGGLVGEIEWTMFYVDYLWVDDRLRGYGLGRDLVRRAEAEAQKRGCTWATLTTFDFQAPGFYEKLGYRVVGQYDDYPPGHTYYFLRHDFTASHE